MKTTKKTISITDLHEGENLFCKSGDMVVTDVRIGTPGQDIMINQISSVERVDEEPQKGKAFGVMAIASSLYWYLFLGMNGSETQSSGCGFFDGKDCVTYQVASNILSYDDTRGVSYFVLFLSYIVTYALAVVFIKGIKFLFHKVFVNVVLTNGEKVIMPFEKKNTHPKTSAEARKVSKAINDVLREQNIQKTGGRKPGKPENNDSNKDSEIKKLEKDLEVAKLKAELKKLKNKNIS